MHFSTAYFSTVSFVEARDRRSTAVVWPATEAAAAIPVDDAAEWTEAAADAHCELGKAMAGCNRKWHTGFEAVRAALGRLEEFRKKKNGVAKAATNKHAAVVEKHANKLMEVLQRVANAPGFEPASWEVEVRALVESMSGKF
eukprot:SAG22_NODE_1530_length_4216_cov_5.617926_5_plen_142_part_00